MYLCVFIAFSILVFPPFFPSLTDLLVLLPAYENHDVELLVFGLVMRERCDPLQGIYAAQIRTQTFLHTP